MQNVKFDVGKIKCKKGTLSGALISYYLFSAFFFA